MKDGPGNSIIYHTFVVGGPLLRTTKAKWSYYTLGDSPFSSAVAFKFLLEKAVQRPFDALEEVLGKKKPQFVGIGRLHTSIESPGAESSTRGRRAFIMEDSSTAEFIFGKNRWVQRNLFPIRKGVTRFETEAPELRFIGVMLDIGFHCDIDAVRQTSFRLDSKIMIRPSEMNDRIFVDKAGIDRARRQHVCVCNWREARLGKTDGCAVGTGQFLSGDNDLFVAGSLTNSRCRER